MIIPMKGLLLHFYRFLITGTVGLATFLSVALSAQATDIQNDQYEGTLGTSRIGMTVIREGNVIKGGHYFYQRFLQDIPITGSTQNSQITLMEAGGGTFHLHFVGNGSEGGQPLNFENSVGMNGIWMSSDGSRSYPVSLRGSTFSEGENTGRRYRDVTDESDSAFESRVQTAFRAILRGDKTTAVRFISFPLRVNSPASRGKKFRNREEVLAAWNDLFTPSMMAKLQDALPHDMFVHQGMAMLGDGDAWFDSKGLAVLNIPEPAASSGAEHAP
jgi:hypothetical protein